MATFRLLGLLRKDKGEGEGEVDGGDALDM